MLFHSFRCFIKHLSKKLSEMIGSSSWEFMVWQKTVTIIYKIFFLCRENISPLRLKSYFSRLGVQETIICFIEIIYFFSFPICFKIFSRNSNKYSIECILRLSRIYCIKNTHFLCLELYNLLHWINTVFHPVLFPKLFKDFHIKSFRDHFEIIDTPETSN